MRKLRGESGMQGTAGEGKWGRGASALKPREHQAHKSKREAYQGGSNSTMWKGRSLSVNFAPLKDIKLKMFCYWALPKNIGN